MMLPQEGGGGVPGMPMPAGLTIPKHPKMERALRIETHMNYQLTQEMVEWDADMDRLLIVLPVLGQCYKKTYFGSVDGKKRNISELVLPSECVVNGKARTMDRARRITHQLYYYTNDVYEKIHRGLWTDPGELGMPDNYNADDSDAPHEFLEQHRYQDLDGDGYKEPYIVTVHTKTQKVVRVLARWQPEGVDVTKKIKVAAIEPDHYFTHYGFIPNPDGSMNYLGFGQLLEPINASANTVLNQLLDAGSAYNAGGGFVGRGIRMRGGNWQFKLGEWKMVDVVGGTLKENLVPLPLKEPSSVLFQLLGFLVQAGKEISSVQDILTGDAKLAANMPVGTAMALVEQGLKVFTAIYKRVYRSLTEEFKKLYKLNGLYLNPEESFRISGHSEQYKTGMKDYAEDDLTVVPIADPNLSSDMQRLLKAQALKDLSQRPGLDEVEITRRLVNAIQPENADQILLTDGQIAGTEPVRWKPPPLPQMIVAQAKAQRLMQQAQEDGIRLQLDIGKYQLEMEELRTSIGKLKSETMLNLAKAEDAGRSDHIELYKQEMDRIAKETEAKIKAAQQQSAAMQSGQQPGLQGPPAGPSGGPAAKPIAAAPAPAPGAVR